METLIERTRKRQIRQQNVGSQYYLSPEQIAKILETPVSKNTTINVRNRIILSLLAKCGLRLSEVVNFRIEWVDWQEGVINILGKGQKTRTVPLPNQLLQDLKMYIGSRHAGWAFTSKSGKHISHMVVVRLCRQVGEVTGITNPSPRRNRLNPHLFRHSFAREFLKRGGRMEVLMEMLGHESIKTTIDVYGRPSITDIKAEYHRVMS